MAGSVGAKMVNSPDASSAATPVDSKAATNLPKFSYPLRSSSSCPNGIPKQQQQKLKELIWKKEEYNH